MSVALDIRSEDLGDIIIAVETLGGAITGDDVRNIIGGAAFEVVKAHFEKLANDEAHHQSARSLGAQPTGFYERASKAVQQPQLEGDGVSISINQQGLAQRLFGGTIEAKPGGYLTIPARAEAYGHRAGEFHDLRLIIFGATGLAALVDKNEPAHEGSVYFWLVRSVTQQEDPTVLPTEEEILEPAIQNAQRFITRIWDERIAA